MFAMILLAAEPPGEVAIDERPFDERVVVKPAVSDLPIIVRSGREPAYLSRIYSAREAVLAAAERAPKGNLGRYAFSVRAVGWDRGRLYLNSELDYRDPRNVSAVIGPEAAKAVLEKLGGNESEALDSKMILVTGIAMRTRIDFLGADGQPSGKYYYQTQIPVELEKHLKVIELRR